jgi:hypothetical protein
MLLGVEISIKILHSVRKYTEPVIWLEVKNKERRYKTYDNIKYNLTQNHDKS